MPNKKWIITVWDSRQPKEPALVYNLGEQTAVVAYGHLQTMRRAFVNMNIPTPSKSMSFTAEFSDGSTLRYELKPEA